MVYVTNNGYVVMRRDFNFSMMNDRNGTFLHAMHVWGYMFLGGIVGGGPK